ncbi:hypothetical protein T4B_1311, partial [Trichinella pseudospiralis]
MHKIDMAIRVSPTTYREMCGVFVMHIRRLVVSLQAQLLILSNQISLLMYLTVTTRPDIAFAVSTLSQFIEKCGKQH